MLPVPSVSFDLPNQGMERNRPAASVVLQDLPQEFIELTDVNKPVPGLSLVTACMVLPHFSSPFTLHFPPSPLLWQLCVVPWFMDGSALPLVRAQASVMRAGAGGRWEPPCGGM